MATAQYQDNYCNGSCIQKSSCRYILEGLLQDLDLEYLNGITLPARDFTLEQSLHSLYKEDLKLHCCEINKNVFKKQQQFIKDWSARIQMYNQDVLDLRVDDELNFVWLDLCGYLTESTLNKLVKFSRNLRQDSEGIFAITLLSSRQGSSTVKFYRDLQKEVLGTYFTTLQNFRNKKLPVILENILTENTECKYELKANYTYKPTSGGGVMSMYAYSWSTK
jgi:hypothetical protein